MNSTTPGPFTRRAFLTQTGAAAGLAFTCLRQTPSLLGAAGPTPAAPLPAWPRALISRFHVNSIWSDGSHNAFPGIARVGEFYYVTFRHASGHVSPEGNAKIFVIRSPANDLKQWTKVAEFTHEHDTRDPLVFDNGGKVQVVYHSREDYYSQSSDGLKWSTPRELDTEIVRPAANCSLPRSAAGCFGSAAGPMARSTAWPAAACPSKAAPTSSA